MLSMSLLVPLTIASVFVFWIVSEIRNNRALRIIFGTSLIASNLVVAYAVGQYKYMNANLWYGEAVQELLQAVRDELSQCGDCRELDGALERFQSKFVPTYENRARFDEITREFVADLAGLSRPNPTDGREKEGGAVRTVHENSDLTEESRGHPQVESRGYVN